MIDIAPSVFHEEIRVFEIVPREEGAVDTGVAPGAKEIEAKKERLAQLSVSVGEVNQKIRDVEEQRYVLVKEKEELMKEAYELLEMLCEGYLIRYCTSLYFLP